MKNKKKITVITIAILLVTILSIVTYNLYSDKEVTESTNTIGNKNNNMISMMVETEMESGKYKEAGTSTWPGEDYKLNESLSKCENGSKITFDSKTGKLEVNAEKSDRCYIYFDISMKNTIKRLNGNYYEKDIWQYTDSITEIELENTLVQHNDATEIFDISAEGDKSVMAYKVGTKIYIQADGKIKANSDSSYLFADFTELTRIIGLDNLDTSNVIDMSSMFYACFKLTNLDLSSWDISKVMDMSGLFYDCYELISLNTNTWNTKNVTNMEGMFYNCNKLTELDLNNWDTSNVIIMRSIFNNCSSLITLYISDWNTSNVTDMSFMFEGCSSLTALDLNSWNTESVTAITSMFKNCSSLTTLNLNNWNTGKVTAMSSLFSDCASLTELKIKSWDTRNVLYMQSTFSGCSSLTELDLGNWETPKLTNTNLMFRRCTSLTKIDMRRATFTNLKTMSNYNAMFINCNAKIIVKDEAAKSDILRIKSDAVVECVM